ncbi:hypothetical protein Hanom_Chr11g00998281 [Helianthus anomalus]
MNILTFPVKSFAASWNMGRNFLVSFKVVKRITCQRTRGYHSLYIVHEFCGIYKESSHHI